MIVAGVMSGTSADGINVAMVRIAAPSGEIKGLKIKLLGHEEFPYPPRVRNAVLAAMNSTRANVADLARLNFLLGELYAEAVLATQRRFRVKAALIGCHGQTLYHQGEAADFRGRKLAVTWQTGDGSIIAARTGVPVVTDFRPADMAAGGKGAPLVPFLDYLVYRDWQVGRIVQNIGGIANLTAIPPAASPNQVIAFDTGPGNMVIDQLMQQLFGKPFDRGGKTAKRGTVLQAVVGARLQEPFFVARPPKTAGREQFGGEYAAHFLAACRKAGGSPEDTIATATALTAQSVALAYSTFLAKTMHLTAVDFIVSGGGARNLTLLQMLREHLEPLGCTVQASDDLGLPAEAKEAAAFALLAYETWHRRPGNIPSATGAVRPVILGQITYV
jgi:anhydro-N-acetylmuramic acid kinase